MFELRLLQTSGESAIRAVQFFPFNEKRQPFSLGESVVPGPEHVHENLRLPDLSGDGVADGEGLAGIVDEQRSG